MYIYTASKGFRPLGFCCFGFGVGRSLAQEGLLVNPLFCLGRNVPAVDPAESRWAFQLDRLGSKLPACSKSTETKSNR